MALSCTGSISAAVQLCVLSGNACQTSGSIPELVRAGAMQFFTCEEVAASQCDSSPEALRVPGASWAPLLRAPPATFNSVCPHSEFWFCRDPGSFTDAETRLREFGPAGSTRPRKAVLAVWGLRWGVRQWGGGGQLTSRVTGGRLAACNAPDFH